jgi:hypothetical protein
MADLTGPTGSLFNNLMANSQQVSPEVGMGATRLSYTDRHAYTVIKVINPKMIVVQRDIATRTDKNGMSESQTYEYAADPEGSTDIVTLRKNGRWVVRGESAKQGTSFLIGFRKQYHDYSF